MKRQVLPAALLLLIGANFAFAQYQTRDLNQIRNRTSARNKAIEDYDRRNQQNQIVTSSLNERLRGGKIPGADVRSYVLAAQADTIVQVLSVENGDTLKVSDGVREVAVRIIGIDAPEEGQDFYDEAKKNLSDLVANKKVVLVYSLHNLKDELGYFPARIFVDDVNVGLRTLENGFAWRNEKDKFFVEKEYDEESKQTEAKAQIAKIGIWRKENPQKPWEYRKKLAKEQKKMAKK